MITKAVMRLVFIENEYSGMGVSSTILFCISGMRFELPCVTTTIVQDVVSRLLGILNFSFEMITPNRVN
jgi:hypothetical protein